MAIGYSKSVFLPSMLGPLRYNPASASPMQKAALLYNPDSGGRRGRRRQVELESALKALHQGNVDAEIVLSHSTTEAQERVRQAIQAGCDTIFACGGDGTINNVIQVLANTRVALAILPMGTANALAHDIGLPMNVVAAARAVLRGTRRVALGRIEYLDLEGSQGMRFFVVAAGAGVDAHLFYKLHSGTKQRMGMAAYYAKPGICGLPIPWRAFKWSLLRRGQAKCGEPRSRS